MLSKHYFIRHYSNIQLIWLNPLTYMLKFRRNAKCYYHYTELFDQIIANCQTYLTSECE